MSLMIDANLSVIRKLSESKYSVYLAEDKMSKLLMAIKSYPLHDKSYQKEKTLLRTLFHPHIVKCYGAQDMTIGNQNLSGLELEYAPYGDLLEILQEHRKMPEILARTLFHHLIEAISYLHERNLAHLDIKVDNLLLDQNFDLKLTDFDLAQELSAYKLEGKGTPSSRAPEVIRGDSKNFKAADIYSAAVVLFIFLSGCPPYVEVSKGDNYEYDTYYKMMRTKNESFWALHSKHRGDANFYSPEFKELFTKMMEEDPNRRATIEEIKQSKWYKQPILTKEECRIEMKKYMKL